MEHALLRAKSPLLATHGQRLLHQWLRTLALAPYSEFRYREAKRRAPQEGVRAKRFVTFDYFLNDRTSPRKIEALTHLLQSEPIFVHKLLIRDGGMSFRRKS